MPWMKIAPSAPSTTRWSNEPERFTIRRTAIWPWWTTGRSIDHIGFEIKNLEAFTKKLEADGITLDRPYTKVPQLGIAIAFIKDPWGTNIEMTEGLVDVK